MRHSTRDMGFEGEKIAASFLESQGYRLLERGFRCPFGEVDIIAQDGDAIVFVEVKRRRSGEYGAPETAVDLRKQRKISRAALAFLKRSGGKPRNVRFDVISILGSQPSHIRGAFESPLQSTY